MSSTPETATGLSDIRRRQRLPLLANRSSVPAPDDEKLSLTRWIEAEGRRIGGADRAGGDRAGGHGVADDGAAFAPLIVAGKPSPAVISLIRPGSGPDRFSMAI